MEDSLIWAKNRHFFGGIEPSVMKRFRAVVKNGVVSLDVQPPGDTVVDGQTLCTVAGVIIRRKTYGYPVDEFDGELVRNVSVGEASQGYIIDSGADTSTINYYAAFPYTTQGVYNRSEVNRCSTRTGESYIYGYDLNTKDPEPSTRVSYPNDVDNTYYAPVYMDNNTSTFNYGGWSIAPGTDFMPKPCVLNNTGARLYYLNPNDYSKKEDGDDSVLTDPDLSVMMEWPKIYTYREETPEGIYKFRCSNAPHGDGWECWCNYNKDDVQVPHFYTAVYPGIYDKEVPVSNKNLNCEVSDSGTYDFDPLCTEYIKKLRGDRWDSEVLSDHLLIQDLLVMMAKTTDGQAAYGYGNIAGSSVKTGVMDQNGLFWSSNTIGVKVFGMEHLWGYCKRLISGWVYDGSNSCQKIKITPGTKDGSTVVGYVMNGSGYIKCGSINGSDGYISEMTTTPFGRLPSAVKGASNKYEADRLYTYGSSYIYLAIVGGKGDAGPDSLYLGSGPFTVDLIYSTTSDVDNMDATIALSYR